MCSTLRPSMVHGSIKWSCGLASWPVVFLDGVISIRSKILKPVCVTSWKSTTPTTPIRIAGPIRDNLWSGRHLSVKLVASNVRVGRGLALGHNDLNVLSIHSDLINALRHYW